MSQEENNKAELISDIKVLQEEFEILKDIKSDGIRERLLVAVQGQVKSIDENLLSKLGFEPVQRDVMIIARVIIKAWEAELLRMEDKALGESLVNLQDLIDQNTEVLNNISINK